MRLDLRLVSPLEKVFPDQPPVGGYRRASALLDEIASFQVAWIAREERQRDYMDLTVECDVPVQVRHVRCVPVSLTTFTDADADYLRKEPGLFPDLLEDMPFDHARMYPDRWECAWIDVEGAPAGEHPVTVTAKTLAGEVLAQETFTLKVVDARLPEQEFRHTRWFHCDCLCNYYGVEMWSDRFWEICESFVASMVKRGVNMLLTPVHTPPLDTAQGGERMTCQLVDVYAGNSGYTFGFERLEKWVAMAKRCGVRYYEIAHLFTQWGAKHAPKIVADVCGEKKRIFGWDTEATGTLYKDFLRSYLPALTEELKKLGIADRCYFHISDEPHIDMLDDYRAARDMVTPYLKEFPIIDALSNYEFYKTGAIQKPIPAINHMDDFVAGKVPGLWTYYCIGQYKDTTNTFMAMPSQRTRILGVMLYKYEIEGFLQWGYNFWSSQFSTYPINPFVDTDCSGFTPAGDAFQVYPGADGRPMESLRLMVISQAMYDLRALKLLESLKGRDFVMTLIEDGIAPITFTEYPREAAWLPALREKVNAEIEKAAKA